jgi:uncharacterized protein (TIGR03437 family)
MLQRWLRNLSSAVLLLIVSLPPLLTLSAGTISKHGPSPETFLFYVLFGNCLRATQVAIVLCAGGALDAPDGSPSSSESRWRGEDSPQGLRLEANLGQTDKAYPFLGKGPGYFLYLNGTETALDLRDGTGRSQAVMRMTLEGARPGVEARGEMLQQHRIHYFLGQDATKWVTDVPTFGQVRFGGVYRGIDLVYYAKDGEFEHDFVVAPGADPGRIRMRFTGAEEMTLTADGGLRLRQGPAAVLWGPPRVYQQRGGRRAAVPARYEMLGEGRVGFTVEGYDRSATLVIDPTISFLTYAGNAESSLGGRSAVDSAGNIYLTGAISFSTWPVTPGAAPAPSAGFGPSNALLMKVNATGTQVLYSTYFGGIDGEIGAAVAVDAQGNAYVTGVTDSRDFPTTQGAFRPTVPPASPSVADFADCFVTKFNAAGSAIVYSTYLHGTGNDGCTSIAVDGQGNAYVTGGTDSNNYPTTEGAFQTSYRLGVETQRYDVFVTKLNAAGSQLAYSTFVGGGGNDFATSIAVDGAGNAYVTGTTTSSSNFPLTQGAADTSYGGHGGNLQWTRWGDAFAFKLNPAGTQMVYSTYIGGNLDDLAFSIAVDGQGAAYVAGNTLSPDFPTTAAAFQRTYGGAGGEPLLNAGDAFVTKIAPDGRSFAYSTYLGGSQDDRALQIAVDAAGNASVVGNTLSANFPVTPDALQRTDRTSATAPTRVRMGSGFLAQLNAAGSSVTYATYLGGTSHDWLNGVGVTADGSVIVTGTTNSADLPVTAGVHQRQFFGGLDNWRPLGDLFVARFGAEAQPSIAGVSNAASYVTGLAPGMIAVMAGTNIGPENLQTARLDAQGRVATTLAETQVLVSNRPAPLVYASARQTSFIVPYETAAGANAQIVAVYKGVRSPAFSAPVVAANPGVFSANSSGTGPGAILNQDNSFNTAQNPAEKGSIIVFFLTGEGQTDPPGTDGQIASSVFPKPVLPVRVEISGVQAEVLYAGAVPGQVAGLMQVNARIPEGSNQGPVPVQITVGTGTSQRQLFVSVR